MLTVESPVCNWKTEGGDEKETYFPLYALLCAHIEPISKKNSMKTKVFPSNPEIDVHD